MTVNREADLRLRAERHTEWAQAAAGRYDDTGNEHSKFIAEIEMQNAIVCALLAIADELRRLPVGNGP